jgi:predicted dehydrogenase
VGWADAFTNGFREFYNSIFNNTYSENPTYSDFENATYIMKIVDACLKSSENNSWERI